jgi:hypothetical protein
MASGLGVTLHCGQQDDRHFSLQAYKKIVTESLLATRRLESALLTTNICITHFRAEAATATPHIHATSRKPALTVRSVVTS